MLAVAAFNWCCWQFASSLEGINPATTPEWHMVQYNKYRKISKWLSQQRHDHNHKQYREKALVLKAVFGSNRQSVLQLHKEGCSVWHTMRSVLIIVQVGSMLPSQVRILGFTQPNEPHIHSSTTTVLIRPALGSQTPSFVIQSANVLVISCNCELQSERVTALPPRSCMWWFAPGRVFPYLHNPL